MGFIYKKKFLPLSCMAAKPHTPAASEPSLEEQEARGIRKPRLLAFSLAGCCQRLAPFVTLVTTPVPRD